VSKSRGVKKKNGTMGKHRKTQEKRVRLLGKEKNKRVYRRKRVAAVKK